MVAITARGDVEERFFKLTRTLRGLVRASATLLDRVLVPAQQSEGCRSIRGDSAEIGSCGKPALYETGGRECVHTIHSALNTNGHGASRSHDSIQLNPTRSYARSATLRFPRGATQITHRSSLHIGNCRDRVTMCWRCSRKSHADAAKGRSKQRRRTLWQRLPWKMDGGI
jgi:hypothetical protein